MRPRLVELLNDNKRGANATWVVAPAGSGKTTLLATCRRKRDAPPVWFQLDASDSDPAAFFDYLGLAAERVAPGVYESLPRLTPEYGGDLSGFIRHYGELLFGGLPSSSTIVLDNFQDLAASSAVHGLLARLISTAHINQRFVFASREAPPKDLTRLRANQQLVVVDWSDLRFTYDECCALLVQRGIADPQMRDRLARACDGWVAGLVLLLSIKADGDEQASIVTSSPLISDYFSVEALGEFDEDDLELLIDASVFPNFSPRMVGRLCNQGQGKVEELLSEMHKRQFFITRHGSKDVFYSFHGLFADFLHDEFGKRRSLEAQTAILRRAAAIALEDGQVESAAALRIQAHAWDSLATLCIQHASAMLTAGRHETLLKWITQLPKGIREQNPWVALWHGAAQLPYAPKEAEGRLHSAYDLFKAHNQLDGRFLAWALTVESLNYAWDSFATAPYWLDELEDLLREADYPSPEIECRIALALLPMLIWADGGAARFPSLVNRCYSLLDSVQEPSIKAALAGSVLYFRHAVEPSSSAAEYLADSLHVQVVTSRAVPAAKIYWFAQYLGHCASVGAFDAAQDAMREALGLIEKTGIRVLEPIIMAWVIRIHISRHDGEDADALLARLAEVIGPERRVEKLLYLFARSTRLFQVGDVNANNAILRDGYRLSIDTHARYPQALFANSLGYNYFELGQPELAQRFLDVLGDIADQSGNIACRFMQLLLEAERARYQNDSEGLIAALKRAMRFGREQQIIGVAGLVQPMTRLYALALQHGVEETYVKHVITALELKPDDRANAPPKWPWSVRIRLLGNLSISARDETVSVSGRQKKVVELLSLLVVKHRKPIGKGHIMERLWPDSDSGRAEQNLKSTVVRLRKLLGVNNAVVWRNNSVSLDKKLVWTDCWEVEALLGTQDDLRRLWTLYQGPILQSRDDAWLIHYRGLLHKQCGEAFCRAAREQLAREHPDEALDYCNMGRDIDKTLEELYQIEIRVHIARGEFAEARRTYESCREILAQELGAVPSAETQRLISARDAEISPSN